ncbi:MAG TPA: hypothetical protein DCZ12_03665 [Gammaproteobacteria bacterium]|nr:hypothetical protein [Gammaproteobacteria bacterium]
MVYSINRARIASLSKSHSRNFSGQKRQQTAFSPTQNNLVFMLVLSTCVANVLIVGNYSGFYRHLFNILNGKNDALRLFAKGGMSAPNKT